jgi:hypothetical protein
MTAYPGLGTRVNGKIYDFSSCRVNVDGLEYTNVTEISYSHGLDPGILRGTSALWRGRSRGTYETDGSFSMYKEDYEKLITALVGKGQGGYMMAEFQIIIMYRELGLNVPIIDTLVGVRIKHDEDSYSSGNDPLVVKADLSIFQLLRNGKSAVDPAGSGTVGAGLPAT